MVPNKVSSRTSVLWNYKYTYKLLCKNRQDVALFFFYLFVENNFGNEEERLKYMHPSSRLHLPMPIKAEYKPRAVQPRARPIEPQATTEEAPVITEAKGYFLVTCFWRLKAIMRFALSAFVAKWMMKYRELFCGSWLSTLSWWNIAIAKKLSTSH